MSKKVVIIGGGFAGLALVEKLKQKGIAISSMGHGKLRIVTHLDYKEVMHEYVMEVFSKLQF